MNDTPLVNFEENIRHLSLTDLHAININKSPIFRILNYDDKACQAAEIILQFEIDSRIINLFNYDNSKQK